MRDTTSCPECGKEARVEWRCVLESTDGPIEHCKVRCGQGHWFLLPVSMLDAARRAPDAAKRLPRSGPQETGQRGGAESAWWSASPASW